MKNYIDVLPANGYPKSFKSFIDNLKIEYAFSDAKKNFNVLSLIKAINDKKEFDINNIFSLEDYVVYFEYLLALKINNNNNYKEQMSWFANNISYQDLYKIKKRCGIIDIQYDSLIYKGNILKFFE